MFHICNFYYLCQVLTLKNLFMKQFERALDFIKTNQNNAETLALFLEQLLVEATEEMTQTALDNTEDFLTILNANK